MRRACSGGDPSELVATCAVTSRVSYSSAGERETVGRRCRRTSSRKKGFSRRSVSVSPCCSMPRGQSCERKTSTESPRFLSCRGRRSSQERNCKVEARRRDAPGAAGRRRTRGCGRRSGSCGRRTVPSRSDLRANEAASASERLRGSRRAGVSAPFFQSPPFQIPLAPAMRNQPSTRTEPAKPRK